jgi:hypothetical protein
MFKVKVVDIDEIYIYVSGRGSRNSSVCIATGYGLDGRGSIHDSGKKFFYTSQRPDGL